MIIYRNTKFFPFFVVQIVHTCTRAHARFTSYIYFEIGQRDTGNYSDETQVVARIPIPEDVSTPFDKYLFVYLSLCSRRDLSLSRERKTGYLNHKRHLVWHNSASLLFLASQIPAKSTDHLSISSEIKSIHQQY